MPTEWHIIDDEAERLEPARDEDRLNHLRIRSIAHERRAAHRRWLWSRAFVLVFACMAIATAAKAYRADGSRQIWLGTACLIFTLLTLRASFRLRHFTRLPATAPEPPPSVEALNALSDGSQFSQGLDQLARRKE